MRSANATSVLCWLQLLLGAIYWLFMSVKGDALIHCSCDNLFSFPTVEGPPREDEGAGADLREGRVDLEERRPEQLQHQEGARRKTSGSGDFKFFRVRTRSDESSWTLSIRLAVNQSHRLLDCLYFKLSS